RHLVRLEPDAHGEGAVAQNIRTLYSTDSAQLRLHHAGQIVGNLVLVEVGGGKADVHRSKLIVGGLQVDDRRFRFRRQVIANLRNLRLNLRERGVGVIVQLQVHGDRAQPLGARRLHIVDTVSTGDDTLQRRGDESTNQVGVGAHV